MKAAIALCIGWAIGFGGPVLVPSVSWMAWVAIGSSATFWVMSL